jgi:mitotic-spindle organizing protein 1
MDSKATAAEALDIVYEINKILDCGLDKETLSICVALIEHGVSPEVITDYVDHLEKKRSRLSRKIK